MTTLNWDKYELSMTLGFRKMNNHIDDLIDIEYYEDAKQIVWERHKMYKAFSDRVERFNAYTTTINRVYNILGYDNPNVKYLGDGK
jgi:hypothetical protein